MFIMWALRNLELNRIWLTPEHFLLSEQYYERGQICGSLCGYSPWDFASTPNCLFFRKIASIFFGCYYSLMCSMNVFQFCWSFYLVMLVSPKVRWNHLVILILSMDENFQTLKDWSIWKPKNEKIENIGPVEDIFFFNCNWLNILCKKGLTCLRCSDITEPRLCTKIERCQDGEVIFWKFIPHSRKEK